MNISGHKMYLIHAGLNTVAVVLLTVGIYFAIKKPQNWFPKHRALHSRSD